MSTAFSRTLRSLERDGFRRYFWGFSLAILLLGAWLAWFCLSPVGRYEVSDTARLEVNQAMYLVQAPITGRVVASHLVLGRMVRAGDILVDLDSKPERLQLAEERTRLQAAAPQIGALREEAAATAQSRGREQQSTQVAQEEARA